MFLYTSIFSPRINKVIPIFSGIQYAPQKLRICSNANSRNFTVVTQAGGLLFLREPNWHGCGCPAQKGRPCACLPFLRPAFILLPIFSLRSLWMEQKKVRQSALVSPAMFVAYSLLLWHLQNFNILLFIHILRKLFISNLTFQSERDNSLSPNEAPGRKHLFRPVLRPQECNYTVGSQFVLDLKLLNQSNSVVKLCQVGCTQESLLYIFFPEITQNFSNSFAQKKDEISLSISHVT